MKRAAAARGRRTGGQNRRAGTRGQILCISYLPWSFYSVMEIGKFPQEHSAFRILLHIDVGSAPCFSRALGFGHMPFYE